MKATEHFKIIIETYLRDRAETDTLFAVSFAKEDKNIQDCITYILNSVKASACVGHTSEEIFSMAVHYYDENNIDIGNPISCNIVVNYKPEITEEEKQEAKRNALKRIEDEAYEKLTQSKKRTTSTEDKTIQKSLFDL